MSEPDGSIVIKAILDSDEFKSGIGHLGDLGNLAGKGLKIAATAMAALGAGLAALGANAIKVGSSFDTAMSQVAATMGTTVDQISSLSDVAKEMGSTTQYTATEAAEALNYLAQAGYDAEKQTAALPQVLNLAAAGAMGLGSAADLVANSMNVLGLGTEDLTMFSNQLAITAAAASGDVSQFGEAVLVCGGQVKLAQMPLVDMNTALGILADNGIKGAEGGTALRNVLKNLFTPTKQASDALEDLGIKTANADGTLRDTQAVLQDLSVALAGLTEEERIKAVGAIFDTRTIAAANALLANSSDRWDELSDKISEASNTSTQAADMAATQLDNLEGDVTILSSTFEGLGIAIYDNLRDSMREGAQAATKALGQLTTNAKKGELSRALKAVGTNISTVVSKLASVVARSLPAAVAAVGKFADALTWVIDNADMLFTVIKAGTAAFLAFKAAMAISAVVKAVAAVIETLTGKLTLATVAQGLFNAVVEANPYVLAAVAIGALVGAIALFIGMAGESETEASKLRKRIEELQEGTQKTAEAMEASSDAYKTTIGNIEQEDAAAFALLNRLDTLSEKTNRTAGEKQEMAAIVARLNELVPELALSYDAEADSLNRTSDEIKSYIEQKKKEALLTAYMERYIQLIEEQAIAEADLVVRRKTLAEAQMAYTRALQSYNTVLQEYNTTMDTSGDVSSGLSESLVATHQALEIASANMTAAQAAFDGTNASINACGTELEGLNGKMENTVAKTGEVTAAQDAATIMMQNLGMTADELAAAQEKLAEKSDAAAQSIADTYATVEEAVTNAFEKIESTSETLSFEEMTANLEHNQEVTQRWADNLDRLARLGLDEGLIQQLREAGPKSYEQVEAMAAELSKGDDSIATSFDGLSTTAQQKITELNGVFEENMALIPETVKTAFSGGEMEVAATTLVDGLKTTLDNTIKIEEYEALAGRVPEGVANGIANNKGLYTDAIDDMADAGEQEFKDRNRIHSPSQLYEELAKHIPEGAEKGIKDNTYLVTAAMRESVEAVRREADSTVQSSNFASVGNAMMSGITQGILQGRSGMISAIISAAQAAVQAVKDELQIQSPSKVFKNQVGKQMAAGTGEGFIDELSRQYARIRETIQAEQSMLAARAQASSPVYGGSGSSTTVIESLNVSTGQLNTATDYDRVGRRLGEQFTRAARYNGGLLNT